ncbi:MAG: isopentenyl-diphosphate Delta-isomerase [Candidatus Azobacteroides sp.]|nr:isopentenyl-diphosphate Delta-isomerase [Candidatus Azobacteroides sp.]
MVILVDNNDIPIGIMEKLEAHEKGLLHRAFSVFIFNSRKELLIHRRAEHKYHSGGLWTNTCCSHPFPGQDIFEAANRRLKEEMGLTAELDYVLKFHYKEPLENSLIEHEMDYVFVGKSDILPEINPEEVSAYRYMNLKEIEKDMERFPQTYTIWFRIIFERFLSRLLIHQMSNYA